jgi:hypothetical protein
MNRKCLLKRCSTNKPHNQFKALGKNAGKKMLSRANSRIDHWEIQRFGIDSLCLCSPFFYYGFSIPEIAFNGVNISEKNGYLFVSFSVAGFGRKNNLKVVTARGLKKTLQRLERELESRGVFVDIYRMKVCGIDLFLDRHMSDYSKVLNVEEKAKLPYLNKIRWVGDDNPTLYRYNNRRKVCIYDKTKEMLASGKTIPKGIAKKKTPLVRFEWRAKGARTVRNHFNLSSAEDLIKRLNIISRRFFYNNITFPIIYGLNLVDLYHCLYKPTWIWFFVDILIGSIKEAIIAVLYLKVPP